MSNAQQLALVRAVHTAVYLVMATAASLLFYAGVTGSRGGWLWVSIALLGGEAVAFLAGGLRCPLTVLAVRLGANRGHAFDTFAFGRFTRVTFRFFGALTALGLVLLVLRWAHAIR
jgi:hypothetical protein